MSTPAPGWYDDGSGTRRWWDGQGWTEQVQPDAASDTVASDTAASETYASEPRKRTPRWVWFVTGGAVVVLLVLGIVLAVVVSGFYRATTEVAQPGTPAEEAAVRAVQQYDQAWAEADCATLEASTTEEFRLDLGIADCAVFIEQAGLLAESTDDYALAVRAVRDQGDGSIAVDTSETYTSMYDENGEPAAVPIPIDDRFTYIVVEADGTWVVDNASAGE